LSPPQEQALCERQFGKNQGADPKSGGHLGVP
jgi:hypothetical protein